MATEKMCVLIPSFNEARTIGGIIRELKRLDLAVYVIDDGSTDDTASVAKDEGALVIKNDANMGKGASLRAGFERAIKDGFDAILIMDGDGQHSIDDIRVFLKKMDESGSHMVIGNRMLNTSSMPLIRVYTNRFMSKLISMITGQAIPDSQCGFRLIKTDLLRKISLKSSKFEIESEIIIKAARAGFRIDAVPVKTVYRDEKSRINPILDTLRFIVFIIKTGLER